VIRKLTLVVGFGAGYVLGAKAGTQRYDQIVGAVRGFLGQPAVQEVTHTLADTATQLGDKAKATVTEKVTEKVTAVGDKVTGSDLVDLTSNGKSRTGARTATAPIPGAAPSVTAPDV
jgi:hypothetical protein